MLYRRCSFFAGFLLFCVQTLTTGLAPASDVGTAFGPDGSFETDRDADGWPDGWGKVDPGGRWANELGNRFVRLESTEPGKMVMLYQEISLPQSAEAIRIQWRQRVSGLKRGKQSWFDARVMVEFLDANRQPVGPHPPASASGKDLPEWTERAIEWLVPAGARTIKFMPSLFQVEAGTLDLDDIEMRIVAPDPIRQAAQLAADARRSKLEAEAASRREKAAEILETHRTLVTHGDFETEAKRDAWPEHWGKPKRGASWEAENENRFVRLHADVPNEMIMLYRTADIPSGVAALELKWRERITGLRKGTSPWFDARLMLEFQGIDGKKLSNQPSPAYSQKDSNGWRERSHLFLVPEDALTLVLMPCLFQVQAGTFDIDDITLRPTDPGPLRLAAKQREAEAIARHVPHETPQRDRWPLELKVVGNRVQDSQGRNVWLQGVNAGGLETLPQDKQPIKSLVVAIDEWKANCVRVPIKEEFWYGKSAYQKDGGKEYRETIDQMITLAANRGAYIVIDLHRFRAPKQEHADFWKEFALVYKNHPAVLFDLFNEPHDISWDVWKHGGHVGEKSDVDESAFLNDAEKKQNSGFESVGMQMLVDSVRSVGAKNIVIAGGLFWCNDLSGITQGYALDDPSGHGIMYSWHTYNWHTDWEAKMLETSKRHPIFLGEVGADIHKMDFVPSAAQEDPYTWVPDMLGFIQKHQLHWTGWCLHPKATPVMISDWSYTPTPYWGQFAKDALAGQSFELKRTR